MNTQSNEIVTITVSIEQEGFDSTNSHYLNHVPTSGELANLVLNMAFTELSCNRLLSEAKDRVKLSKPFVFAIAIECGNKSIAIPEISTKISMGDKGVEKLIKHLPEIIALKTMDYNIPVRERMQMLASAENVELVLS